ncbi:MAG TPA: CPBP family intramembrane glutamic endopeptidase [Thermomicrobiaceae bacterium]|nr:CPBP family intramembrane glutamic endopeptidase [Thermomicrobiaceae bacterium]
MAIAGAEVITALVNPTWGVVAHVVILGNLLIHAGMARTSWDRALYLSLVIAPVIRIVSLGMPLGQFPQEWWYALSSVPLYAVCYALVRSIPLTRRQIAVQLPRARDWPVTLAVAASGIGLGWIEYHILHQAPLAPSLGLEVIAVPSVILLVGTGAIEELIFRGILQSTAEEVFGRWPGIVFVSMLFAVLHTGHMSAVDVVFVFGVAVYFAAVVRWTRTLIGVSLAHGVTNIALFIVFPLLLR